MRWQHYDYPLCLVAQIMPNTNYYYTRLTASFPGQTREAGRGWHQSRFKCGKRWWSFGMQWHQLDNTQTICTSLHTDNHTNTSSLNFYRQGAFPGAQPCQSTQGYTKCFLRTYKFLSWVSSTATYGSFLYNKNTTFRMPNVRYTCQLVSIDKIKDIWVQNTSVVNTVLCVNKLARTYDPSTYND